MLTWAKEIIDQMQGIAELLDAGDAARPYATALALQRAKLDDVTLTPSAQLAKAVETSAESFFLACGFDFTLPGEKKALFMQTREEY